MKLEGDNLYQLRDHLDDHGRFCYASCDLVHQLIDIERRQLIANWPTAAEMVASLTESSPHGDRQMLSVHLEALQTLNSRRSLLAVGDSTPQGSKSDSYDGMPEQSPETALRNLEKVYRQRSTLSEEQFWKDGGTAALAALADPRYRDRAAQVFTDFFNGSYTGDVATAIVTHLRNLRDDAGETACVRAAAILGASLRRDTVTNELRSWQKYLLPSYDIPTPYLIELLEASYDPFHEAEEVVAQLGSPGWSGMYLDLEARHSWGRTANRLAWQSLSADERNALLPEWVIEELRETAVALRRRINEEFRQQLIAQRQYD